MKKNTTNYVEQFADRFNFNFPDYQCTRTRTDEGFTLVFIDGKLPFKEDVGEVTFRRKFDRFVETGYVVKVMKESLFFGKYHRRYRAAGRRIYPYKEWSNVIRYDNGKVKMHGDTHPLDFIRFVLEFLMRECLIKKNENGQDALIHILMKSKTIVKQVIAGKITNRKQAIQVYMRLAYHVKRFSYDAVEAYFRLASICTAPSLTSLIEFTTDWEKAVYRLSENIYLAREFFVLCTDAFLLDDYKINPKWSEKRLRAEHQKNIERVALMVEGELDKTPIHEQMPAITWGGGVEGVVLNSEYETYKEASEQHNCIYTHYFDKIKKGDYIGISLKKPERGTIGLYVKRNDRGERELCFEQMKTTWNHCFSLDSAGVVGKFLERNIPALARMVNAPLFQTQFNLKEHCVDTDLPY